MCTSNVSTFPFSSESSASAADAAWGDAAGAAEPSSLAPLLPDDASSDAGLLDASALTGGESETASGEGGRSRMIQRCSPRPPPGRGCPPATPPTTTPDPELDSAHAALQHSSSHGPSSRSLGPTLTENIHRLRTKQVEKIALGPTCDPRVLEPKQLRRANIGAIIFQDFSGKAPPPEDFPPPAAAWSRGG